MHQLKATVSAIKMIRGRAGRQCRRGAERFCSCYACLLIIYIYLIDLSYNYEKKYIREYLLTGEVLFCRPRHILNRVSNKENIFNLIIGDLQYKHYYNI